MEIENAKKFVAILDFEDKTNTYFSIIDAKRFEKGKAIPSENIYLPEVYKALENLDLPCRREDANVFCVEGTLGGRSGLAKFLKPLPWIVEASRYTKSKAEEMPEFGQDDYEIEM